MARGEARLFTDIWSDESFRALSSEGQRMYLFLISQPDLAHDGVIPLRERRWAACTSGMTVDGIMDALAELESAKFVVVDENTGELLVRAHIRRDRVWQQPNHMKAARAHLAAVQSERIKHVIAGEVARIVRENGVAQRLAQGLKQLSAAQSSELTEMLRVLPALEGAVSSENAAISNPSGNPSANPSGNPSGIHLGVRVKVVEEVTDRRSDSFAQDQLEQQPALFADTGTPPAEAPRTRLKPGPANPLAFDRFWENYPRKKNKDDARKAWDTLVKRERIQPEQLVAAAKNFATARKTEDASFTPYPATWLRRGEWREFVLGIPETEKVKPAITTGAWWNN